MKKQKETYQWNPKTYNKRTAFVSQLALPVVDLLDPKVESYLKRKYTMIKRDEYWIIND